MKLGRLLLFFIAIGSSVMAGIAAKGWLAWTAENNKTVITLPSPVKLTTVVVATKPLRYGMPVTADVLAEVDWPQNAVPQNSFTTISQVLSIDNRQRIVLSSLEVNEPVLTWKVSGPGQRASLSAMLKPELRAATIRINEVNGVGGFVLPGDRIDVLLTRDNAGGGINGKGADQENAVYTQLLLQNVHVLAIDQQADDRTDKPTLAKTVTVEVDMASAQKLALAASVGSLSLVLRQAGSEHKLDAERVSVADLSGGVQPVDLHPAQKVLAAAPANRDDEMVNEVLTAGRADNRQVRINVVRALKGAEYDVHSESLTQSF